jgi:hypothetical protein
MRTGSFPVPKPTPAGEVPARASYEAMMELAREVGSGTTGANDPRLNDRRMWRRIMEESHLC